MRSNLLLSQKGAERGGPTGARTVALLLCQYSKVILCVLCPTYFQQPFEAGRIISSHFTGEETKLQVAGRVPKALQVEARMQIQEVSSTLLCSSPVFPSQDISRHYWQSLRSSPKRQPRPRSWLSFAFLKHRIRMAPSEGGEEGSGGRRDGRKHRNEGQMRRVETREEKEGREQALPEGCLSSPCCPGPPCSGLPWTNTSPAAPGAAGPLFPEVL